LWPSTITPQAWSPSAIRHVEVTAIANAERIADGLDGPAFLAPGAKEELITGLADGRVAMFEAGDEERDGAFEVAGVLGARPFGVAHGFGEVVIAAAGGKGLVAANEGRVIPLASQAQGRAIGDATDVAISFARNTVYFTDASDRHGPGDSWAEFVEHGANGRLLAYDEHRNSTETLADGLHFPFGVALARDERFVLVSEMTEYRVLRRWLSGPRAGQIETLVDGLPGYPADVSATGRGTFWIALYAPRIVALDRLAGAPWLRALWFKLPRALQPKPARVTQAVEVDGDGNIVRALRDDSADAYAPVTGALERDGILYLGSPTQKGVLKIRL
jgi:sugar lactone lactonase YvrE